MDSHIPVPTLRSASFLPIIYSPQGSPPFIHVALYLPTYGQESQFIEQLLELKDLVEDLRENKPETIVFIRRDSNVNLNKKSRSKMFEHFCSELELVRIPMGHKTFHHFVGEGVFDSEIDVLLQSSKAKYRENLLRVLCRKYYPEIDSSHDIILSTVFIPYSHVVPTKQSLPLAPKLTHTRHRILWAVEHIPEYQTVTKRRFSRIRETWYSPHSAASVSVLLKFTKKQLPKRTTGLCVDCRLTRMISRGILRSSLCFPHLLLCITK